MGQYQARASKSIDEDQGDRDSGVESEGTRNQDASPPAPLAPVFGSPIDNESYLASLDTSLSNGSTRETSQPVSLQKMPPSQEEPAERKIPIVFRWDSGGHEVYIGGSFNNWETKIPMTYSQGDFNAIVDLVEGKHEYKFFVDGQWLHDANEPSIDNGVGSRNNVVHVEKKHFDAFFDSWETSLDKSGGTSPVGSYTQVMPSRSAASGLPPILPPLLQQTVLNQDQPYEDPTLLPQPNHVILNHLYALSIKDNVLVLAATHRYKKKYVTILTYKPVILT